MIFHMPNKRMQALTLKIDCLYNERVNELNFLGLRQLYIKVLLYNTLILSYINYCIMIWGNQRNMITSIQKIGYANNTFKYI